MNRNDPDALAAIVTPETRSELGSRAPLDRDCSAADRLAWQAKWTADSLGPASGFYVVGQDLAPRIRDLNPAFHIFNVYFEKEGATRAFGLMKIGDEWKVQNIFHAVHGMAENGSELELGPILWP